MALLFDSRLYITGYAHEVFCTVLNLYIIQKFIMSYIGQPWVTIFCFQLKLIIIYDDAYNSASHNPMERIFHITRGLSLSFIIQINGFASGYSLQAPSNHAIWKRNRAILTKYVNKTHIIHKCNAQQIWVLNLDDAE